MAMQPTAGDYDEGTAFPVAQDLPGLEARNQKPGWIA